MSLDPKLCFLPELVTDLLKLDSEALVTVYFDTVTWVFYLCSNNEIHFDLPAEIVQISKGSPVTCINNICKMLAHASENFFSRV